MDFKITKSSPKVLFSHKNFSYPKNFKLAIAVSKKVSKKAVVRNKIRRLLQANFLKNFKNEHNHIQYWVLVNLKSGNIQNYETELLKEFKTLILKTGLLK